jgi:hypothetical protein
MIKHEVIDHKKSAILDVRPGLGSILRNVMPGDCRIRDGQPGNTERKSAGNYSGKSPGIESRAIES